MDNLLLQFINDPYNDTINFELAYSYEEIGQTASALSYYLRCAEFTKNDDLAYECLIRMSLCLSKQGTRETMELICIQHALSIRPDRPEANYLMSLYYSFREKWLDSYMFACNGLINNNVLVLRKPFLYFDRYQLLFQKAYSGYNKGKLKESYRIYQDLLTDNKINDNYRTIISNNLKNYPENMKKHEFKKTLEKDEHRYTINNYHGNEDGYFYIYKNCPISDCIRRGFRWEEHNHDIIDKYVTKDSICVEVGSHIGTISVKLSKKCKHLYCFEPLKDSFVLLNKNLAINRCSNVNSYEIALSNEHKKTTIDFISKNNPGGSGLLYNYQKINSDIIELKNEYPIELITLDSFNIEKLDYLKIDVEGYEKNVIEGGYETIKRCKPFIVMEIYENMNTFNKLSISQIKQRYQNIINIGYKVENIWEHDYLFIPFKENINEEIKEIKNKIDVVLQGKYNENVIPIAEYYLELDFVNNIIISCWEGDNVPEITNDRIIVIKNGIPDNPGTGQRNLQIISSLNGLKKAETEFAIKIRNDQRYTHESMNKMYAFYEEYKEKKLSFYYDQKKPKNRICVLGNFAEFSFHPRDHLFWGNREDLIDLFALPLDTWAITDKIKFIQPEDYALYYEHFIRSETYIGAHYLANFNRMINYYLLDPKKYLYDNSEKYYETKKLSDQLTPQVFKSFPREGIDLEWYKYGWKTYPYDIQRDNFGERWHEDGL